MEMEKQVSVLWTLVLAVFEIVYLAGLAASMRTPKVARHRVKFGEQGIEKSNQVMNLDWQNKVIPRASAVDLAISHHQ